MCPVMSPVTNFPFIGPTGVFWSKKIVKFFYEMRELFVKLYESQKWIPQEFIFDKKTQCSPYFSTIHLFRFPILDLKNGLVFL